ncbi:PepSY domain-containing protein [Lacicoccus alkaliphilus]|uniref:Uncharacterized membrane protein YkoI n=1 Tax=Lacicoccus alkaliphilus DSM 16010 TaxID=1123231 RepID=A0A1M7EBM0_9BACL|nr:PepSY domain-containing protein [Salinicoccus alkaliphilus]SHL89036.1 Uncharacterized membrane protein YkoI [Salinicoccus alkaliphilus DSM 16010]
MKKHKYTLATLVLSTGLVLGACGDVGEDEVVAPEEDDAVEESGTTEEAETADDGEDGDPADDIVEDEEESAEDTDGEAEEDSGSDEPTGVAVLDQLGSTPEEAVSAAQENFDGDLVELKLDQEDGEWVYEVKLENDSEDYEVKMLTEDLSILEEETEADDDNDPDDRFAYEDAIPHDEAVSTAMDEAGGELEEWTLEKDDGQLEYDVELNSTDLGDDAEVKINAESGEIIEVDD